MSSSKITAEKVQQLRAISGFGLMDCRAALKRADGNVDKAIEILRKLNIAVFVHKKVDKN
jgi:elongation factor Ts